MNDFTFNAPVKIFFGRNAHDNLDDLCKGKKVLLDLKGLLNRNEYEQAGYSYWRL